MITDSDTPPFPLAVAAAAMEPRPVPRLAHLTEAFRQLREELDRCVLAARQDGASWAEIAAALGISKQAANKRFHHLEEDSPL